MENSGQFEGLRMESTISADGRLTVSLASTPCGEPAASEVVVRIEAAPIHPADLIPMLAGADPAQAAFGDTASPGLTTMLPEEVLNLSRSRIGISLGIGLEGAGTVVAAGPNAQALHGRTVAVMSERPGRFAKYCVVDRTDCLPLPDGVTARQGAALFCNPLTALAMVETLHQTGQRAMVHTAAASSLGQMLVRICAEDGIALVNIVRRPEQADLLRSLSATHVCDTSAPGFSEDLHAALMETGATVAFDAIGGGCMAGDLVRAMERAAVAREGGFKPYGSSDAKQVYIYGMLDKSPTMLPRGGYGMVWNVGGWAMPPILDKAGPERAEQLIARIADGITTTFACDFAEEISLAQALERETMLDYCRFATGRKYLINPWL